MLDLLVKNRITKLVRQYNTVKKDAINLMQKGDLNSYLKKLREAHQIRVQLRETHSNLSL